MRKKTTRGKRKMHSQEQLDQYSVKWY